MNFAFGLGFGAAPFHTGPAVRPEWHEHEFWPPILTKCYVWNTCFVVRLSQLLLPDRAIGLHELAGKPLM